MFVLLSALAAFAPPFVGHLRRADVLMAADESSKLTRLEAAVATLKDTGASAAALAPLERELRERQRAFAAASRATPPATDVDRFGRKKPTAAPPPPPERKATPDIASTFFDFLGAIGRTLAEQRERANEQAELRRRAAAEATAAAAARQAAEAALSPKERASRDLKAAFEAADLKRLTAALEAAEAAQLSVSALGPARKLKSELEAAATLANVEYELTMAYRRATTGGRAGQERLVQYVEAAAAAGIKGEQLQLACELLDKKGLAYQLAVGSYRYSTGGAGTGAGRSRVTLSGGASFATAAAQRAADALGAVQRERAARVAEAAEALGVVQREQAAAVAKAAEELEAAQRAQAAAAAQRGQEAAEAQRAQAAAAARREAEAAEAREAAEAAAAREAAAAAAAKAALAAAETALSAAVDAAVAQVSNRNAPQVKDSVRLAELSRAIDAAAAADVAVATVQAARERLPELEAKAAARVVDVQLLMALRRAKANTGGVAEMTGLSRAVNAATAAGATDEELLGEARKLLSRKGSEEEQEVARLCARLEKFEKLAAIGEGGERDNAEAMAAQARAKLEELGYSATSKK